MAVPSQGDVTRPATRHLRFKAFDEVIAEIEHLRKVGYDRLGNWSLEQMCFHLGRPIPRPLVALPADPPPVTQPAVVERFRHYVEHGHPPAGATAPLGAEPPATVEPGIVDDLFDRLRSVEAFDGPFVDLGPRGAIPVGVYKPFILAHCGHHLSLLIPKQ